MSNIFEMLGVAREEEREKFNLDLAPAEIEAYFRKNDDVNLSVPLAIVRQVREEVVYKMGHQKLGADDMVAASGMLRALARFEELYYWGMKQRDKYRTAGGER